MFGSPSETITLYLSHSICDAVQTTLNKRTEQAYIMESLLNYWVALLQTMPAVIPH
jgi:hypothetical protein